MRIQMMLVALAFAASSALSAQTPVEQGKTLMDARRYSDAQTLLQPLGKSDATAAFYLGQIAMEQNNGGKAVDWFERAVQLSPRNSVYYDWLGRAYG
ncbi:MAG TPA: tetratricopeptide repeat protein, partial [Gemmatimonadaceae bacterium]|nr:tetratricopeptide repeat protein [Gemmatimonadaceae bacterium]